MRPVLAAVLVLAALALGGILLSAVKTILSMICATGLFMAFGLAGAWIVDFANRRRSPSAYGRWTDCR